MFAFPTEGNFTEVLLLIRGFNIPLYSPNFLLCLASYISIPTKLVS